MMEIFVCVKQVPDLNEVEIEFDATRTDLARDDLDLEINEWDNVAVETAVQLKDTHDARVTVITVGDEEAEDVLRRGLAMGADAAIRLWDPAFAGADAWTIARLLHRVLADAGADLVLTGAVSADEGRGHVGGFLAGLLDLPYVALATALEVGEGKARVRHEVEGGREQRVELALPAVVSVQTGLCEPRYVSIRGIRKVAGAEIPVRTAADLGLEAATVSGESARVRVEELALPERGAGAEMLDGDAETMVRDLVERLHRPGVMT